MASGPQPAYPNQQVLVQDSKGYPASNAHFSTDLCSWCAEPGGCGLCLCSYFCCYCQYGKNVEKLGPQATCGGNCFAAGCFYFALSLLGLPCIAQFITRGEVRRLYGLQPAGCSDFWTTCCCPACDLCQVSREIEIRSGAPNATFGTTYTAAPQPQTMSNRAVI